MAVHHGPGSDGTAASCGGRHLLLDSVDSKCLTKLTCKNGWRVRIACMKDQTADSLHFSRSYSNWEIVHEAALFSRKLASRMDCGVQCPSQR